MRLGLFNGNPTRYPPYGSIQSDQVCSQDHQKLALQAALDGIVLLKNTESLLPLLKSQVSSLAVIGPNANNFTVLLGNYAGPPCKIITPLMGLQSYVKDTRYLAGCQDVTCNSSSIDQAVQLASSVDYVVLFMGLDQTQETEALDRIDLVLPGMQSDLITRVAKAAKKPVILFLLCGGPVDVDFVKSDPKIGAVLWAGYPGQAGGTAIAQILFGEHNPGGKLPMTWYPQEFTRFPMSIMRMRAGPPNYIKDSRYPGRTYRFYNGYSVFQFGYGLSYSNYTHKIVTQFENQLLPKTTINIHTINIDKNLDHYRIEEIGSESCKSSIFPVVVRVKNHGPMDGRHTVLMYMRWPKELNGRPIKQLIGFNNVYLKAGEVGHIKFAVSPCKHLSRATEDGKWVIDKGSHFLMVEEDELEITVSS